MIRILYFGNLPDLLGRTTEEIEPPAGIVDVGGLITALAARGGAWDRVFSRPGVLKVTVNRQFADSSTPLRDETEVAFVAFVES